MFSKFKIEKPQNVLYRRGPRHFEAEHSIISLPLLEASDARIRNLLAQNDELRASNVIKDLELAQKRAEVFQLTQELQLLREEVARSRLAVDPESEIVQTTKGAKIRSGGKGCENQTLSFFYINPPCVARAVIKNKFKTKRVYSVYSNTDRSQLLTIACSQEHVERNKIMAQQRQQQHFIRSLFPAQAGASKLKLSRQREKGVSNTLKLSFIYSLCHWQI